MRHAVVMITRESPCLWKVQTLYNATQEMTGEFNLLLWAAGVACFVSYGMLPQADNLYLGVVLFCVVTVTGVFSYLQNAKSDNMMNEFKSMCDPGVLKCRGAVAATRLHETRSLVQF